MEYNRVEWEEFFCYSTLFSALAVGTGVTYTPGDIRIDSDADFKFLRTMYFATNDIPDIFIKYKDDTSGRYLMKYGTLLRSIAGRSLPVDNSTSFDYRPFIWPVPYRISRATTLSIEAANNHAIITPDVYITFLGGKVRDGIAPWKRPGYKRIPYVYPLTRSATTLPEGTVQITANQTTTASISTDKDSDFIIRKITGGATGAALVTIQDAARDRQWMNTPTHIRNLVGSGAFPNILGAPRFVSRGSVISFTIQDLSGATNNIQINLIGEKLFNSR